MYQDPACKPWNSRQWAPEGYSSREEFETKTKEEKSSHGLSSAIDQGAGGVSDEKRLHPSEHQDRNAQM